MTEAKKVEEKVEADAKAVEAELEKTEKDLAPKLRHELAMLRRRAGDDEAKATAFVDKVEQDAEGDVVAALEAECRALQVDLAKDGGKPKLETRQAHGLVQNVGPNTKTGVQAHADLSPAEQAALRNR